MTDDLHRVDAPAPSPPWRSTGPRATTPSTLGMYEALPGPDRGGRQGPRRSRCWCSAAPARRPSPRARTSASSARSAATPTAPGPTTSGSPPPSRRIEGLTKPTIAMVHGYCIGGGCGLALACDLRFADDQVRLRHHPVQARPGLQPRVDQAARRPGRPVPGQVDPDVRPADATAPGLLELGLADELATPEELETLTYEFAELRLQPGPVQRPARASRSSAGSLAGQVDDDDEFTTELRNSSFDTEDYAEGVRAFLGKRAPRSPGPDRDARPTDRRDAVAERAQEAARTAEPAFGTFFLARFLDLDISYDDEQQTMHRRPAVRAVPVQPAGLGARRHHHHRDGHLDGPPVPPLPVHRRDDRDAAAVLPAADRARPLRGPAAETGPAHRAPRVTHVRRRGPPGRRRAPARGTASTRRHRPADAHARRRPAPITIRRRKGSTCARERHCWPHWRSSPR